MKRNFGFVALTLLIFAAWMHLIFHVKLDRCGLCCERYGLVHYFELTSLNDKIDKVTRPIRPH